MCMNCSGKGSSKSSGSKNSSGYTPKKMSNSSGFSKTRGSSNTGSSGGFGKPAVSFSGRKK